VSMTREQVEAEFNKLQLDILSSALITLVRQGKITTEDLAAAVEDVDKPGLTKLASLLNL
jgi:hypothetical protein